MAAPIVVSGRLWGATSISITGDERFPPDVEERLEKFTSLVAVALSNAQARDELATLAEEQAALSRVAVAVATEERPERLFSVVSRRSAGCSAPAPQRPCATSRRRTRWRSSAAGERDGRFDISVRRSRSTIRDGAIARVAAPAGLRGSTSSTSRPTSSEHMAAARRQLGSRRSDHRLWTAVGRHLDLDERPRAVPARRRGASREVHAPGRRRARERRGP